MRASIPRGVLSEVLERHLEGRRLRAGVFLTYRFEPDFFEQEVVPVVLGAPVSAQNSVLRLVQLEDALRTVGDMAVYYDAQGLVTGEGASAKLDIRRIRVSWPTGIFHPKNAFLLLEDEEPDTEGRQARTLLVATMSANLTRAGWWENLEVCHLEEIREDTRSSLRDEVLKLLSDVKRMAPTGEDHAALDGIREFLKAVTARDHQSSDGVLHPQFYRGGSPVAEWLRDVGGGRLRGLNLEILSPYFDGGKEAKPLAGLVNALEPKAIRVLLSRDDEGTALCGEGIYDAVRKMESASWGRLPEELLRRGKSEAAARRRVHAKVYRFFDSRRRYEALLVGSVNLTSAAHSGRGNLETAILVESECREPPEWWLSVESSRPQRFEEESEEEGASQGPGQALQVRFSWRRRAAEALWGGKEPSPNLLVVSNGVPLFEARALAPGAWKHLGKESSEALARVLKSTAFLTVRVEGEPDAVILVQEEEMAQKPSLILTLSAADILRLWALLKPEQRSLLLEERFEELAEAAPASGIPGTDGKPPSGSIFDTFAGIFHAFGCLERGVLESLAEGKSRDATYRLFGRKYDSLHRLLDRVLVEESETDPVERYVILLCARQTLARIATEEADFVRENRHEFRALQERLSAIGEARSSIPFPGPEPRDAFFEWYEQWFLRRAAAPEVRA